MINCRRVTELCSQEMERNLQLQEQIPLRMHLLMCSGCTNFRKQMSILRDAMQRYANGGAISTTDHPVGKR
jgi:hypothetical protein